MKKSVEHLKKELQSARLKVTPSRLRILELFSLGCGPQSAETISNTLSSTKGSTVGKLDSVTIYRTLTAFEKAGLIGRVDLRREAVFYERVGHHHHHVVCMSCGRTEEFQGCTMDAVAKTTLKKSKHFSSVLKHSLEFFGVCKKCTIA